MSFSETSDGDIPELAEDDGWEDLEPDVETFRLRCLVCDEVLGDGAAFRYHCEFLHGLDIVKVQQDLGV